MGITRVHAEELLRVRVRCEEALREVAIASASGGSDERALATLVAERVASLLGAPSVALACFDGERAVTLGSAGRIAPPDVMALAERSAALEVLRTGASVIVEDYRELGGAFLEFAPGYGGRGVICVPVRVGETLWGALGAMAPQAGFRADAVAWLERFAELISSALANARERARLEYEARAERALRDVAAARVPG